MAKCVILAAILTVFLISSATSQDIPSCILGNIQTFFNKTVPETIRSYQVPKACSPNQLVSMVTNFQRMAAAQLLKCAGNFACLLEALFSFQYSMLNDGAQCAFALLTDGPLMIIFRAYFGGLQKCLAGGQLNSLVSAVTGPLGALQVNLPKLPGLPQIPALPNFQLGH